MPRLPIISKTARHIAKLGVENQESWGTLLETAAAQYPDNAAIKSADGQYTWEAYNAWTNQYANTFISQLKECGIQCFAALRRWLLVR